MRNTIKMFLAVVAVAGLTLSTGCKSDCEKAADHVIELAKAEKDLPKETLEKMTGDEERTKMVEKCNKENKPEKIKCVLEAKALKDLGSCNKSDKE